MPIREAKETEAEFLSDLAFRSKAYWGYSKDFIMACKEELSVTKQDILNETFDYLVYEQNEEVRGFYALERISYTEVELEALFVHPSFIGTGIGKLLLTHAVASANEIGVRLNLP